MTKNVLCETLYNNNNHAYITIYYKHFDSNLYLEYLVLNHHHLKATQMTLKKNGSQKIQISHINPALAQDKNNLQTHEVEESKKEMLPGIVNYPGAGREKVILQKEHKRERQNLGALVYHGNQILKHHRNRKLHSHGQSKLNHLSQFRLKRKK